MAIGKANLGLDLFASGDGEVGRIGVEPSFTYKYQARYLEFDTDFGLNFNLTDDLQSAGTWQAKSGLGLRSPSGALKWSVGYSHTDSLVRITTSENDRARSDTLFTEVALTDSLTSTVSQQLSVGVTTRHRENVTQNVSLKSDSRALNYRISVAQSKQFGWSVYTGYQDVDSLPGVLDIGWQSKLSLKKSVLSSSLFYSTYLDPENKKTSLGYAIGLVYPVRKSTVELTASQRYQDILSYIESLDLDYSIEQQTLLSTRQYALAIKEFKITDRTYLNLAFTGSDSRRTSEIFGDSLKNYGWSERLSAKIQHRLTNSVIGSFDVSRVYMPTGMSDSIVAGLSARLTETSLLSSNIQRVDSSAESTSFGWNIKFSQTW